jgi:uncharacterized protein YbaP (TraB family)
MIAVTALILSGTSCQCSQPTLEQTTCLWKIDSEHNAVYLLGSIHILRQEDHPLPKLMEDAYDGADALVFEIDLDSAETVGAQYMILSKATGDGPNTLRSMLTEDAYDIVTREAAELGLSINQLGVFEPWFVALYINQLKVEQLGFESKYGVDEYFYNKAQQAGKDLYALETLEYQVDCFDQLNWSDQEMLLLEMFAELAIYEADSEIMVDSWRTGNTTTLEEMVLGPFEEYPHLYTKFVSERNENWLPQIEGFLQESDDYLVIVGAGHLVGPDGLITLLQNEGYSVEQVEIENSDAVTQ